MPRSKFVVSSQIPKTFRTEKVKGMFDVNMTEVKKEFEVDIPIESIDWNVGLIVGASGSGKTTITSHPAMIAHRCKSHKWIMTKKPGVNPIPKTNVLKKTTAWNRLVASFKYVG